MGQIKVLCLYIHYPLTMASYFVKALRHRADVDLKTTGPETGNWIPWMGGMSVLPKYADHADIPLPFAPNIGSVNYELVKAQLGEWKPDLVLTIDAGIHFKYKPTDGIVAHVATDPHVLNYDHQRSISDKFFNMQKCYSQKGDIYLPYAYSKYDFYPVDTVSKSVDACMIGMPYPQRIEWVNALRARGVSVTFENGPIFDEARELYAQARIGLNWSSMKDLNCRVFELAAMGICPVVNRVPDLPMFFQENIDYLGFDNMGEAIEKVVWAKEHPETADLIGYAAHKDVQQHTYDVRVDQILKEIKLT